MNDYFVYALVDPRDNTIFYIGKGKNNRPKQHLLEAKRFLNNNDTKESINPYKIRKILNILNAGYESYNVIYLHTNLDEATAFELETLEIANHKNLTNISLGGSGGDNISNNPNYAEICHKISESGKRRFTDPEARAKCARPGKSNGMYGKTHTDEAKEKMSASRKGITFEDRYGHEKAEELKNNLSKVVKTRLSDINNISWAYHVTDEQVDFIRNAMESGEYSWYLLEKRTKLTKKVICRVCKQYNIKINVLYLRAGNLDQYYGEDAEIFRLNKSLSHRGEKNGRYKTGKCCKEY